MISAQLTGLARLTFAHRASQVYLALVAAVTLWAVFATLHEDASFAFVWVLLLAAPTIFVFLIGGDLIDESITTSSGFFYASLVLSVLIQSAALGALTRLTRASAHRA